MSIVARSGNSFKNLIKTFPQQKSSTELKDKTLKNSETKTMSSTFKKHSVSTKNLLTFVAAIY